MLHKHGLNKRTEVRLENVSVHYYSKPKWLGGKPFKALDNLNIVVDKQSLAVVGPSGAGKSTLIELLFSKKKPTLGEVYICEQKLSCFSAVKRRSLAHHIQLIPQEPQSSLNPYYDVRQTLLEPLGRQANEALIKAALTDVGLEHHLLESNTQALSVGQAQRVAIARALLFDPCLLVADEPTSSLDPVSRKQVLDLLAHLQHSRQMRLLLVTHDLAAAKRLCDEILVLDKGKTVEHSSTKQLISSPKHPITQALVNAHYKG